MDRQSHYYLRPTLDKIADCATDRFEVAAPALAAVRRHQNQPTALEIRLFNATAAENRRVHFTELLQGIDYSVSSNRASFSSEAGPQQISLCLSSRRQQDCGDCVDDLSVSLLRERIGEIAAAQPCFHMYHRDLRIKAGERRSHCRGGVTLDENDIRSAFCYVPAECAQYVAGRSRERAADRFSLQCAVRCESERGQS
jgi:hypothetical protein